MCIRDSGKTYNGTYEVMQKTPKGTDYEIIIDGVTGYALSLIHI